MFNNRDARGRYTRVSSTSTTGTVSAAYTTDSGLFYVREIPLTESMHNLATQFRERVAKDDVSTNDLITYLLDVNPIPEYVQPRFLANKATRRDQLERMVALALSRDELFQALRIYYSRDWQRNYVEVDNQVRNLDMRQVNWNVFTDAAIEIFERKFTFPIDLFTWVVTGEPGWAGVQPDPMTVFATNSKEGRERARYIGEINMNRPRVAEMPVTKLDSYEAVNVTFNVAMSDGHMWTELGLRKYDPGYGMTRPMYEYEVG